MLERARDDIGAAADHRLQRVRAAGEVGDFDVEPFVLEVVAALGDRQRQVIEDVGHVLVVEDNAVNRMLIATYLDEFGVSHDMVASVGTAILNLASKHYDAVLMDVMMPDLDLRRGRRDESAPRQGLGGEDRGHPWRRRAIGVYLHLHD